MDCKVGAHVYREHDFYLLALLTQGRVTFGKLGSAPAQLNAHCEAPLKAHTSNVCSGLLLRETSRFFFASADIPAERSIGKSLEIAEWAASWPMVLPYFDGNVPAGLSPLGDPTRRLTSCHGVFHYSFRVAAQVC